MGTSLKQLYKEAQAGNNEAILQIIKKFNPVISKYTYQLDYEDSKSEIILFMLELIKKIEIDKFQGDGQIVNYTIKSMKNEFIRLSKLKNYKNRCELLVDDLFDNQEPISDDDFMHAVDSELFFITLLLNHLNIKERTVLYKFLVEDKPIAVIAMEEKVTRQAVNQTKNNALQKLRKNIDTDTLQLLSKNIVI